MARTNTLITLFVLLSFSLIAQINDYFYFSPDGRENLEISLSQIIVQFDDNTSFETQQAILGTEKDIAPLQAAMMLPSPQVTLANLENIQSAQQVESILANLNAQPQIVYANPIFVYADGTKMALQEKLLVRLHHINDFPLLETTALTYGLNIERANEFDANLFHLTSTKTSYNALAIANELYTTGLFNYIEPDFLRLMKRMNTNDPAINNQWSLNNNGQYGGTTGADMNVYDAWMLTTGSNEIKVAVIDEGVDINHPDLLPNLEEGYDATEQNSAGAPSGNDAHGTACAGIVAAAGNNNIGMAGVAHGSRIIPVRIAYSQNGDWITSSAWIGNAINWSWQNADADILSNSWGGGGSSFTINNAIDNAVRNGRNGLGSPVLFAAGNENTAVSYPATNPSTIAVAAMSMCNERKNLSSCDGENWWGSNYGVNIDVAAPGTKIYATDISGSAGYSSSDYISGFNGTSSATPNVAGVMALILSANSNLTEQQARYALESTCRKVGNYNYADGVTGQPAGSWNENLGYGAVDAAAAIQAVAPSQNNDAGIMEISAPTGIVCGAEITPTVKLRNNGSNTLTSATINFQVDNGQVYTSLWTGNLASTQVVDVQLATVPVAAGIHALQAYTTLPNGNTDSNIDNDRAFTNFTNGDQELQLRITLDNYGTETSWDIQDANGNELLAGGPYENNAPGSVKEEIVCLPAGCFSFNMYDAYGDGMCCGYGEGAYELIKIADNTVFASGGQYEAEINHSFCLESTVVQEEEEEEVAPLVVTLHKNNDVLCFNGRTGAATATVSGGTAPYTYSWSNGSNSATVNNLSAGAHDVTVRDANGTQMIKTININQPDTWTVNINSNTAYNNEGGSASVAVSGATAPYSYAWSNGGTNATISNLASGSYTVTIVDKNECSTSISVVVENQVVEQVEAPKVFFENGVLENISEDWQTITLDYNYSSMVVVATVRLPSVESIPVITRIRNATNNSFDIRIQVPRGNTNETYTVDYMVAEEGTYNETEHGVKMEAVKALSTQTAHSQNWLLEARSYANNYTSPVVFGQVMSYNDTRWSIFWASANTSRSTPPLSNSFAAGKNVGEDSDYNRSNETIGYIVLESGLNKINDTKVFATLGDDSIMGVSNTSTGFNYEVNGLNGAYNAVVSTAGMDGVNGGWPTLLGNAPVSGTQINLAFDEDQVRDPERAHTTEQAAMIVFEDPNAEEVEATDLKMEQGIIEDVSTDWMSIQLNNTYNSMVVVATVVAENNAQAPAITRIQNANGNSFDLKIQNPGVLTNEFYQVQYFVIEEGVYNKFDHGVNMEAVKTISTKTSSRNNWQYEMRSYNNTYNQPVVLGQVMSHNDANWSVFWASNGNRKNTPTASNLSIGKHVGEDGNQNRANETIGYVVIESGEGTINGMNFTAGVGADAIYGIENSSAGYKYNVAGTTAGSSVILSAAGMDGSDCGWPVLLGANAVSNGQITIAFDEDRSNDQERAHTSEQAAFIVFNTTGNTESFTTRPFNPTTTDSIPALVEMATFEITTYPNPTVNYINVVANQTFATDTQINIMDSNGQLVQQQTIKANSYNQDVIQLDVNQLTGGQYFLNVSNGIQQQTTPFTKIRM